MTCKTCKRYLSCMEADREYPCRDWERRRHGRKKGIYNTSDRRDQNDPGEQEERQRRAAGAEKEEKGRLDRDRSDSGVDWPGIRGRFYSIDDILHLGDRVDMMRDLTFKQWAVVTAVTIGIFAGLFLGAFWTA